MVSDKSFDQHKYVYLLKGKRVSGGSFDQHIYVYLFRGKGCQIKALINTSMSTF